MGTNVNGRDMAVRAGWVWKQMAAAFGASWTKQFGDRPSQLWVAGLANLADDEIKRGVAKVLGQWSSDYPPTWPQFRDLARPPDGRTGEQRARDALMDRQRAEQARLPMPSIEQLAEKTTAGRKWHAFQVLEGLRPMPPGWDMDIVDAHLEGCDVEAMRAENIRGAEKILREHHVHQSFGAWARGPLPEAGRVEDGG